MNLVDRDALNKYVFEANLNPKWLYGPKRYAPGLVSNPEMAQRLRIFNWVPQPALPWFTTLGCYMDTDGNGMVHSLDNWAANRNFGKVHPMITYPKESAPSPVEYAFELNQNYPNPFNPSTNIAFTLPEASQVSLKVIDVLGREVATLVNGRMSAGSHTVTWNADGYQSGVYMYRLNAIGLEDGNTYVKTLKMTFAK
ncbi:MAG: T9SS type A sorting domain-containing protein [Chlorobi bacterium]|nr:T9SS type A sorting domain-containing protein [Chlorobiota bacterium]